jgi:glycine betaine/proline transport system substrate-binding protein
MTTTPSSRRRLRLLAAMAALALFAAACGTDPGGTDGPRTPVRLAEGDWETMWINNAIVAFIAEHGYGRDVELANVTIPVMQQAIVQDDVDVIIELYPQNIREWWDRVRDSEEVVHVGQLMEATNRGFYVPRYVVEGDAERGIEPAAPDLRRFEDMPEYAHLFPDPEDPSKGLLIGCTIGWTLCPVLDVMMEAGGFDEHLNVLVAGSTTAMDTAIVRAYERGDPVLFYYWEPTWLTAQLDLIRLDIAPFDTECEAARNAMAEGEREIGPEAWCGFPTPAVEIAVSVGFADRDPDVTAFLEEMFLGTERVSELALWQRENDAEASATALHYLATYEDQWRTWVPDDVADRVAAAVAQRTG